MPRGRAGPTLPWPRIQPKAQPQNAGWAPPVASPRAHAACIPAAFDDALGATRALGSENLPLVLAGDSSGANLALAAALALREDTVELSGLLLYYPIIGLDFSTASYLSNAEAPLLTRARCIRIWNDYLAEDVDGIRRKHDWRAAPLLAEDFGDLPPTVVVVAEYDPLLSDGAILVDRIAETAGGSATLICAPRMPHGFLKWRGRVPEADAAIQAANSNLLSLLKFGHAASAAPSPGEQ